MNKKSQSDSFETLSTETLLVPGKMNKPVSAFHTLIDLFLPSSTQSCTPPGRRIPERKNGEELIWIITSGNVDVYSKSDEHYLGMSVAPFIVGLQKLFSSHSHYYSRVSLDATIYSISLSQVRISLGRSEFWRCVAEIFSYYLRIMTYREEHLIHGDAYTTIRMKILEYMYNHDEHIKKTGIASYIQASTQLSRSHIYNILFQLINSGCIEVVRGKLIKVNYLPMRLPSV